MSCAGPYYGVGDFSTNFDNQPFVFYSRIDVTRYTSNLEAIGKWTVGDGLLAPKLGNIKSLYLIPKLLGLLLLFRFKSFHSILKKSALPVVE